MKSDKTRLRSIRIPVELDSAIQNIADKNHAKFTDTAVKLMRDAINGYDIAVITSIQNIANPVIEAAYDISPELGQKTEKKVQERIDKSWKFLK